MRIPKFSRMGMYFSKMFEDGIPWFMYAALIASALIAAIAVMIMGLMM